MHMCVLLIHITLAHACVVCIRPVQSMPVPAQGFALTHVRLDALLLADFGCLTAGVFDPRACPPKGSHLRCCASPAAKLWGTRAAFNGKLLEALLQSLKQQDLSQQQPTAEEEADDTDGAEEGIICVRARDYSQVRV